MGIKRFFPSFYNNYNIISVITQIYSGSYCLAFEFLGFRLKSRTINGNIAIIARFNSYTLYFIVISLDSTCIQINLQTILHIFVKLYDSLRNHLIFSGGGYNRINNM